MKTTLTVLFGLGLSTLTAMTMAQEWEASKEALSSAYAGKAYSPYAERDFPDQLLWGETHLHTKLSMDARAFGNRLDQRDAYRAARGEEIMSSSGQLVRLSRPLDWLVTTEHTDGMGMMDDVLDASPLVTKFEQGERWSQMLRSGGDEAPRGDAGPDRDILTGETRSRAPGQLFTRFETVCDPLGRCDQRRRGVQ